MHLAELKAKSPSDLLTLAEELEVENASSLRKQDMMFAILKAFAENDQAIHGDGTLEILPDGFGFLRNPEANYLPGPECLQDAGVERQPAVKAEKPHPPPAAPVASPRPPMRRRFFGQRRPVGHR